MISRSLRSDVERRKPAQSDLVAVLDGQQHERA
jgi:hypothetical protein